MLQLHKAPPTLKTALPCIFANVEPATCVAMELMKKSGVERDCGRVRTARWKRNRQERKA